MIITVGRQVGSGGRLIGKMLSDRLGISFYDREILDRASAESGIRGEFFAQSDEHNSLLDRFASFFMADHLVSTDNCLSPQNLFKYQSDAIRKAATEGQGAVFVGRCSDYILRDMTPRLDIFVTARMECRTARAAKYFNVDEHEAEKRIRAMESAREEYYNFFTEKRWGAAESYHLCIDTSDISMEQATDIVMEYARLRGLLA